jgi:hypothetical protein
MPSVSAEPHTEACASSGTSPPETFEDRVRAWCWWAASIEELIILVRVARGTDELAIALAVIRERKGNGVALEVASCL